MGRLLRPRPGFVKPRSPAMRRAALPGAARGFIAATAAAAFTSVNRIFMENLHYSSAFAGALPTVSPSFRVSVMLRNEFYRILVPLLAGLLLTSTLFSASQAAESRLFVIPSSDGYGISECFEPGRDCGPIVADAWCEAHGHSRALAFGKAEDGTASVEVKDADDGLKLRPTTEPGAILVRCGE